MNITPAQMHELLLEIRRNLARRAHILELYELYLSNDIYLNPIAKQADLEGLQNRHKQDFAKYNKGVMELEQRLKQDEEINGWKGENRFVEL